MKNPYKRPDHRAAFEKAIELTEAGLDYWDTFKRLDHEVPRYMRQKIAAKVARLVREGKL